MWVALLVVLVRLAAILLGSKVGCDMGGVKQEHKKMFWMSQITQVGSSVRGRGSESGGRASGAGAGAAGALGTRCRLAQILRREGPRYNVHARYFLSHQ